MRFKYFRSKQNPGILPLRNLWAYEFTRRPRHAYDNCLCMKHLRLNTRGRNENQLNKGNYMMVEDDEEIKIANIKFKFIYWISNIEEKWTQEVEIKERVDKSLKL